MTVEQRLGAQLTLILVLFSLFCIHSQAKATSCTQDGIYFVKDGEENYHPTIRQDKNSCQGKILFESFNCFNSFDIMDPNF